MKPSAHLLAILVVSIVVVVLEVVISGVVDSAIQIVPFPTKPFQKSFLY